MTEIRGKNKSKGARFVRFYPSDWRSGCIGLTLEQEGLYIRLCAFIYETSRRLPLDDAHAAKLMGLHTNAFRKIITQLDDAGKVHRTATGWTVNRAERELEAAIGHGTAADQEGASNGSIDQDTGGDTRQDTLGDTPLDTPYVSGGVFSENANENNAAPLEPIANSQKPIDSPKPPEGASGEIVPFAKPVIDWRTAFGTSDDHAGIEVVGGELQLVNGTRQHWLAEFGNDERALANALREAHAAVNPGSRKSLKVQVEAKLASIVRDNANRAKNALAIAAVKVAPKPFRASRW